MSQPHPAASPPSFTPSELVVLFGDRFAAEGGMLTAKEEVLTSGAKVSAEEVGQAAALAALLAADRAGTLKLETRTGKALFGLLKTEKVHAAPGAAPAAWPEGSLERALSEGAAAAPTVQDLFQGVLGEESYNPWQRLAAMVKAGLAGRGLLDVEEKKTLKIFTTATFTLPETTRAAAAREDVDAVRDLLRTAESGRAELYRATVKAVRAAVTFMTTSSD
ncbi:MAG TPA: hypothetical protein VHG91_05900 [Longimicrobium sp.]|nr:hypothetical protein [Longimicrobium sp.]